MGRLVALSVVAWTSFLLVAPTLALAAPHDNGEGLVGETDDKIVTFSSLAVIAGFAAFVILASIAQAKLDKRRERKEESAAQQRSGW